MSVIPAILPPAAQAVRVPPLDYEAEQSLLGAIFIRPGLMEAVADIVLPDHFADPVHGQMWSSMLEDYNLGKRPSPVIVNGRLAQDPQYQEMGGKTYIARLAGAVVTTLPDIIRSYAERIADLWLRRETILTLTDALDQLYDTSTSASATSSIESLETSFAALTGAVTTSDNMVDFATVIDRSLSAIETAYQADGQLVGVTTGLRDLNQKLGGLHASDLIIVAGRPSMGKTALAQSIAEGAGRSGKKVALFSVEMPAEQIGTRSIAGASRIEGHRLREGRISQAEAEHAVNCANELKALPIWTDDTSGLTVPQMRTRARRLKRKQGGLDLIVVDYLQLMRGTTPNRDGNRVQEISEISRGLKALAKELNVPVVALSQLSRAVEQREDKRPQLSDLRDSGSIEQDADVVMFVYREQYYLERAEPSQRPDENRERFNTRYSDWQQRCTEVFNTAEIIIGKQRHGPVGTVRLFFDGNLTKFGDLDHQGGGDNG